MGRTGPRDASIVVRYPGEKRAMTLTIDTETRMMGVPATSLSERDPMTRLAFYGIDAIHLKERDELLPGRLVVIEGTDGVGRSTQLNLLRPWLESSGYVVVDTETTSSVLAGA